MAELSNYLENELLDHILRGDTGGTSYAQPSAVYLALHTANPTDTGSGAEVTGGSYGRKILTFGAAASGISLNTNTATFSGMPSATVTHIAIWDSLTFGQLLFHSSISSIIFGSGDSATVAVGAISVSLD